MSALDYDKPNWLDPEYRWGWERTRHLRIKAMRRARVRFRVEHGAVVRIGEWRDGEFIGTVLVFPASVTPEQVGGEDAMRELVAAGVVLEAPEVPT